MISISSSFSSSLLIFHGKHRYHAWLSGVVLVLLLGTSSHAGEPNTGSPRPKPIHVELGKLPLTFIENGGQWDEPIRYALPSQGARLYFGDRRITVVLQEPPAHERREASLKPLAPRMPQKRWVVQIGLVDARKDLRPEGVEQTLGKVSYFKGNKEQWQTGLPTYHAIRYREVWPGIDLEYRGAGPTLKSTFVVKPGADPKQIRLAYQGAERVGVTDAGVLVVSTPVGGFREDAPEVYQEAHGQRKAVGARYRVRKTGMRQREVRFALGQYDRRQPLIIDPLVTLGYAGYIGGGAFDSGAGVAVDGAENAYVTGETSSDQTTFPDRGGPDLTHNGGFDAFVAKVRADGTGLVYAGYIGGSGFDGGRDIAVDGAGNAYITGQTNSGQATFPEVGGPDLTYNGGDFDAFVAKVRADGTGLVYAGYIGGGGNDIGRGITVDGAGNTYITGQTNSGQATFPEVGGPDLTHNGVFDAFVAKVRADGTGLVYAGYIGGSSFDVGDSIAVDGVGTAYVLGSTQSDQTTFPVVGGPDLTYNGVRDAFVAKVRADGTGLVYAGYIGGSGSDAGLGIAVDGVGNAYVTGWTASDQVTFPERGGPDLTFNGSDDAFVAKVLRDGTGLVYAGYIGGGGSDAGLGIAMDGVGNAYVTGWTASDQVTFPERGGPDLTFNGVRDAFVAKVVGPALFGIGVFRPGMKQWLLDTNRNGKWNGCVLDDCQGPFGLVTDLAVVGDWNSSGLSKIGVYRPSTRQFFLDYNGDGLFTNCTVDRCTGAFGLSGDRPVVGNWLGGTNPTRVGVFRSSTQRWSLDKNGNGVVDVCTVDLCLGPFGESTDIPVAGDWTGDGKAKIGVFRPRTGQFLLDRNGNGVWNGTPTDLLSGVFGLSTDKPVVGDWTGDGKWKIGVFRPGSLMWYLDGNGNGVWNGCSVDLCRGPYGTSTDQPVTGAW